MATSLASTALEVGCVEWPKFPFWAVAFAFVLLLPHTTLASDYSAFGDGNDLIKDCKAYTDLNLLDMRDMSDKDIRRAAGRGDPISGLQCLAYVMGVIDDRFSFRIDEMASTGAFDPAKYFCFPHGEDGLNIPFVVITDGDATVKSDEVSYRGIVRGASLLSTAKRAPITEAIAAKRWDVVTCPQFSFM